MRTVIDSNVPIVANGKNVTASYECQLAAIVFLQEVVGAPRRRCVYLDSGDLIFDEYKKHLSFKGQPGVGDAFFKFIHDHMHGDQHVKRVDVTPVSDATRGFMEIPHNNLDKSDRKFLAVAVVAKAEIVNATDSDWQEHSTLLHFLKIRILQLCNL
jgi:hypothetical protein